MVSQNGGGHMAIMGPHYGTKQRGNTKTYGNGTAITGGNMPPSPLEPQWSLLFFCPSCFVMLWSVVAERSSLPDSSSGVSNRMWVRIPAVTLVSLSKRLNHNCFSPPRG